MPKIVNSELIFKTAWHLKRKYKIVRIVNSRFSAFKPRFDVRKKTEIFFRTDKSSLKTTTDNTDDLVIYSICAIRAICGLYS